MTSELLQIKATNTITKTSEYLEKINRLVKKIEYFIKFYLINVLKIGA